MKIRRIAPGSYESLDGSVKIVRNPQISGAAKWIVYSTNDRYSVSDPKFTLADCIAVADCYGNV